MYFNVILAYPVKPNRSGAATLFIQNIMEKENINAEKMLTSKLKPSHSQNAYLSLFFLGRKEKYVKWQFTIYLTYTFLLLINS